MEKVNVIIRKNVTDYLEDLVFILYENEYYTYQPYEPSVINYIFNLIDRQDTMKEKSKIENIISNKQTQPLNQILYGPPGTGKTYHTINKAIEIIENRIRAFKCR